MAQRRDFMSFVQDFILVKTNLHYYMQWDLSRCTCIFIDGIDQWLDYWTGLVDWITGGLTKIVLKTSPPPPPPPHSSVLIIM